MIADNSSDVVYETTPDGVIRWVSPAIEQLLGYAPSEFRGTLARDHVHPDDLAMVDELRLTVYAGSELDEIPCRFRRADGTVPRLHHASASGARRGRRDHRRRHGSP